MKTALIGHTGFVGSNLKSQYNFTDLYNSKNFQKLKHQTYDLVVCAGISAIKWMANKEPQKDLSNITALQNVLNTIKTQQFILISTIDVYATTQTLDEEFDCSSISNHAYGTHRLAFEKFCTEKFDDCTVIRLPGLFGNGLKKNVIYDLLNNNCLEMINTKSSYQYYYLKYLWKDIQIAINNNIKLVNLFTEPVSTQDIVTTFFFKKIVGQEAVLEGHYNLHTKHANIWGNNSTYIYSKKEMLEQLSEFISEYKKQQEPS